jgi:hypothetical protein
MTKAELLLRRAAYCRDLARRGRPLIDQLVGSEAEKEGLRRYLDGLEAEALALEKQAAEALALEKQVDEMLAESAAPRNKDEG